MTRPTALMTLLIGTGFTADAQIVPACSPGQNVLITGFECSLRGLTVSNANTPFQGDTIAIGSVSTQSTGIFSLTLTALPTPGGPGAEWDFVIAGGIDRIGVAVGSDLMRADVSACTAPSCSPPNFNVHLQALSGQTQTLDFSRASPVSGVVSFQSFIDTQGHVQPGTLSLIFREAQVSPFTLTLTLSNSKLEPSINIASPISSNLATVNAAVHDSSGQPGTGVDVMFTVTAVDFSTAGHAHLNIATAPVGDLQDLNALQSTQLCTTDATGTCHLRYVASPISGMYNLDYAHNEAPRRI